MLFFFFYITINIINDFTVTLDQLNESYLNKSINVWTEAFDWKSLAVMKPAEVILC